MPYRLTDGKKKSAGALFAMIMWMMFQKTRSFASLKFLVEGGSYVLILLQNACTSGQLPFWTVSSDKNSPES